MKENSICTIAVHNVLQPHKNNKAKLHRGTYKITHKDPASRSLPQVLPSSPSTILLINLVAPSEVNPSSPI